MGPGNLEDAAVRIRDDMDGVPARFQLQEGIHSIGRILQGENIEASGLVVRMREYSRLAVLGGPASEHRVATGSKRRPDPIRARQWFFVLAS